MWLRLSHIQETLIYGTSVSHVSSHCRVLTVINLIPLGQAGDALERAIIQRSECNFNQSLFQLIHLQWKPMVFMMT